MLRVSCYVLMFVGADSLLAQMPPAEPFTFHHEPKNLQEPPPTWWCIAASPDGKTILTGFQRRDRGELLVWDALTGQVVATVNEPKGIRSVAFAPDGSLWATGNFDHTLRLYDAKTCQLIGRSGANGHTSGINAVAFSADGKRLATAGLDQQIGIWDMVEFKRRSRTDVNEVLTLEPKHILEGHTAGVLSVALSPDGTQAISGSFDRSVRLWSIPSKADQRIIKDSRQLEGHSAAVESVAWSANGQRMATGSWDNTARLWDSEGKELAVLKGHTRGILALTFSPDSQTLLTASGDETSPAAGELRLWGAERGTDLGLLGKHEDMIRGVTFLGGNRTIASIGRDRVVRWWNTNTKTQERQLRPATEAVAIEPAITAIAYSPDGQQIALADDTGSIRVVNRSTNQVVGQLRGHTGIVHAIAWVPKQAWLVSVGNDQTAIVWDVGKQQPRHTLKQTGVAYALAVAPDGLTFAVGGFDKTIRLYDPATGQEKGQKAGHTASVRSLAFSPSGKRLASGSSDFTIRVWSLEQEQAIDELRDHTRTVRVVRFIDEQTLVSTSDDRMVKRWNLKENEVTTSIGPHSDSVISLAVSPRGRFFVVGTADGAIHVYDSVDGYQRATLTGPTDGVAALAIAPDSQEIAGGGYDRQWRRWGAIEPAIPLGVAFVGHRGPVRRVVLSPDAQRLFSGGADGTVRLWDTTNGQELHQWSAHEGGVTDVGWSRDGRWLITGGMDGTAKLWDASTRQLVRTFTPKFGAIRCVTIAENGATIALGGTESKFAIYDRDQPEPRSVFTLDSPAKQLRLLNDDHLLLTTTQGQGQLWHTKEKRVLRDLAGNRYARIKSSTASMDGSYIAVVGREPLPPTPRSTVRSNDLITLFFDSPETRINSTSMHRGPEEVIDVATSADANVFVASLADGQVIVWENGGMGKAPIRLRQFYAHSAHIEDVSVSVDGQFFVTASADGTARLWTGSRGPSLIYAAKLTDERKQTWFARVSPDGSLLATGGDDQVVHLRRGTAGTFRTFDGRFDSPYASAIHPNGSVFVTGHHDGSIRVWDVKKGNELQRVDEHAQRINAVAFNSDGSRLITVSGQTGIGRAGEIRVWDTATWKPLLKLNSQRGAVLTAVFAPDDRSFATGGEDRTITIWDSTKGTSTHTLALHNSTIRSLLYANEGRWLVSLGDDRQLSWYDLANNKGLGTRLFEGSTGEKLRLAPDGKTLAIAIRKPRNQGYFVLLDLANNQILHENKSFQGVVNDFAFSPDGQTLVAAGGYPALAPVVSRGATGPFVAQVAMQPPSGGAFQTMLFPAAEIRVFDVKTGRSVAELPGHSHWITSVQFTPDGKEFIATSGYTDRYGEIRAWSTAGLRPFLTLTGHRSSVTTAAFNKDGSLLATGGAGKVLLWDMTKARRGEAPAPLEVQGHEGLVRQVLFTPDGRLVSAGDDGIVNLWNTQGERLLTIRAHTMPIYGFDLSADGTRLATAAGDWRKNKQGEVRVWDIGKGTELLRLADQPASVWSVAFLRNDWLAVGQQGASSVKLFDLKTKQEVRHLSFPDDLRSFARVGDTLLAGVGGRNGVLKVWDQQRWSETYEVPAHPGKVAFMVDISTAGKTFVTAGGDAAAVIWQVPRAEWPVPILGPALMPQPQP